MGYYPTGNDHRQLPRREQQYMRRWIAAALMCLCLALAIAPRTVLADSGGWTLGPQHDVLTKGQTVLISVEERNGQLTIGSQQGVPVPDDLDLTGSVTDEQGNSYSIVSIGNDAFKGSGVASVKLPSSMTSIGEGAFANCARLASVEIPGTVTNVGRDAFSDCSALKALSLGDGINSIGERAFFNCRSLESVEVPGSVDAIGEAAFSGCIALESLTLCDGVGAIGDYAFDGCTLLSSVEIPGTVKNIGTGAFFSCSSLTSLTLRDGVETIGGTAFYDCLSLASVEVPDSVTSIGDEAFSNCDSLESVVIPDSVTFIGKEAFYGCDSLGSVTLGGGVKTIGSFAFSACSSLSRVTVLATSIPALRSHPFDDAADDLVIIVPAGRFDKYELSWDLYEDRLRPGYTLTVGGEPVGTLYIKGDKVSVPDAAGPTPDACHSFAGWRVASGEGSVEGDVFTMGDSDAVLEASYDEHHTWGAGGHCAVCGEIDPDFRPSVTSGDGASWRKGEAGALTFTSDAAYADFERVLVDGVEVDRSLYTVEEGSTIVTFGAAYLGTLREGGHTVSIVSSTGTANAKFTVLPVADSGGDEADGDTAPDGGATPDGGTTSDEETTPDGETSPDGVTPDDGTVPDGGTTPDGGVAPGGSANSNGDTAPGGNAGSNGAANGGSDAGPEGAASGSCAEALAATGDSSLPSAAVATLGAALAAAGALVLGRRRG